MVYNIRIQIHRTKLYNVDVKNSLYNNVDKEPYDKLSKSFIRYRHTIKYKNHIYDGKDYNLHLEDPNAWFYKYIFDFYKPKNKVESVDIFFQSNDGYRKNPLIFGFNEGGDNSYYYTYYNLRSKGSFTSTRSNDGLIKKEDLLTRLIEERGLYVSESYNKFVIRFGDKPKDAKPFLYPKSGHNKERIALTKKNIQNIQDYVKYEHEINELNNVESFYISFNSDSLFIIGTKSFGKLKIAYAYYNKYNADRPVIFVFKSARQTRLYKCSQFFNDVNKNNPTIKMYDIELFNESELEKTLKNENKQVNKEITFNKNDGINRNISTTGHKFVKGIIDVFRVMLKPKLDYGKSASLKGPWEVYKSGLVSKPSKSKIEGNAFDGIHDFKFTAIYVYYSKDLEALLVAFISDSGNKFFRLRKDGKSWEETKAVNIIDYDGDLIKKLKEIVDDKKSPATERLPKPGTVQRQEGSVNSSRERGHTNEKISNRQKLQSPSRARQFSRPASTQSRHSGTTDLRSSGRTDAHGQQPRVETRTSQPTVSSVPPPAAPSPRTDVPGAGPPSTELSGLEEMGTSSQNTHTQHEGPSGVRVDKDPHHQVQNSHYSSQNRGNDLGSSSPLGEPPPSTEHGPIVTHSPTSKADRGETETILQTTDTHDRETMGVRVDQGIYTTDQHTFIDETDPDSVSDLKPSSADPQIGDQPEDNDDNDDQTITNIKIVGGVATTAIGAGAIGGGVYYANAALSLINWLV